MNMAVLGPTWQTTADIHKECRKYVLMSPPQGSPAGMFAVAMDEGSVRWMPSVEEEEALRRLRDFIRTYEEQSI